jgi:glycerol-3-phosphate dehydrogenase
VLGAEVVHAVRHEMALKLADVVLRRTDLGSASHPGPVAIRAAAALMRKELNWSAEQTDAEVREVEALYRLP